MTLDLEETMVAFLKAVMWEAGSGGKLRHDITIGALFGTDADGRLPSIQAGLGYHDWRRVLYCPAATDENPFPTPQEMDVEEAVKLFLAAHRQTPAGMRGISTAAPPGPRIPLAPAPAALAMFAARRPPEDVTDAADATEPGPVPHHNSPQALPGGGGPPAAGGAAGDPPGDR